MEKISSEQENNKKEIPSPIIAFLIKADIALVEIYFFTMILRFWPLPYWLDNHQLQWLFFLASAVAIIFAIIIMVIVKITNQGIMDDQKKREKTKKISSQQTKAQRAKP